MSDEWDKAVPAGNAGNGRRGQGAAVDRLPPHSEEAERGVLGCILLAPADGMLECRDKLAGPEVFYDIRHQVIYETMLALSETVENFDLITLVTALKARQQFEPIGGMAYLAELPESVPSAANLTHYLGILKDQFLLRTMLQLCTRAAMKIQDPSEGGAIVDIPTAEDIIEGVERDVMAIGEAHTPGRAISIRDAIRPVIQKLDDHHRGHKLMKGLPTGFNYIDNMLCGLNDAEVVLIGGRPGLGKTSLVLGMAMNIAKNGLPVGMFSLEMTTEALSTRMLFMEARASLHKFRNGFLSERDASRLMEAPKSFKDMPLLVDDTAGLNIQQLSARARRMYRKDGVRLFIVDYMQLIKPTRRYNNREQEVAEVSSGILALAKELKVPFLVCVQLNRESAKTNRAPELTDFRDSGQVEQDCHVAGILWKPDIDEDDPKDTTFVERAEWIDRGAPWQEQLALVNLKICKNRNGPTGDCGLVYYKQWTRFADAFRPTGVNLAPKKKAAEEEEEI